MQRTNKLFESIYEKIPQYYAEAIDGIFDGKKFENFDIQKATNAIRWCYEKSGYKMPPVIAVENPFEGRLLLDSLDIKFPPYNVYNIFSEQTNRQMNKEISDVAFGYENCTSLLNYDLYSELCSEIQDKLRERIAPSLSTIHATKYTDEILGAFGKDNLDEVALLAFKFLDAQPGTDALKRNTDHLHFKKNKDKYYPFLDALSVSQLFYLTFIQFLIEELDFPLSNKDDFEMFYTLHRESGIFACCCFEQVAVITKYPRKIFQKSENGWHLHNTQGNAVQWNYAFAKFDCHYINGIYIDTETFEKVNSRMLSFDEFIRVENEEKKAAIISMIKETFGEGALLDFLNTKLIDEKEIQHSGNYTETIRLYRTSEYYPFLQNRFGEMNQPFAWIEFTCPSTKNTYLISTCPNFINAVDAAKWHRPEFIPETVPYIWTSSS